jgi:hypothetical protein
MKIRRKNKKYNKEGKKEKYKREKKNGMNLEKNVGERETIHILLS